MFKSTTIKVLVVHYRKELLEDVAEVLRTCSLQVTCVDHCGAALRLLSETNNQFDLLLIDSGMSDMDVNTFLRITKNMDVLFVVMSEKEVDDAFILEVFKSGAFLVIKTPLTSETVGYIRQDVSRKRMQKQEICDHQSSDDDDASSIITCASDNCFEQTIPALGDVGHGSNDQNLPSIPTQAFEETPDLLKDLIGNPNDI